MREEFLKWDKDATKLKCKPDELIFFADTLVDHICTKAQRERDGEDYLNYFRYEDWDIGDDDKLRVGDHINLNHQRLFDGYEQNLKGKIVLHYENKLPVVLYNIDITDGDESGDYGDLQSLMMDGWTFARIEAPNPPTSNKQ